MLARGSEPIMGIFLAGILLALAAWLVFGGFLLAISLALVAAILFVMLFFRDPERHPGSDIVAPADGVVTDISDFDDYVRIATFMNVHNVHVNRAPIDCVVKSQKHMDGKCGPAYGKDAENNERTITLLETKIGGIKIVQIAGVFARRIVSYVKEGQSLSKGERIGMIRFGSRVDLYLPKKNVRVTVKTGEKVRAGESTVAEFHV